MLSLLRDVYRHRELLLVLAARNLKIRYKGSTLGFLWSLLVPLAMILIYALFLHVMRFTIDLPALVTGILVWQFLSLCAGDSLHAVVGNANLVTKAAFPRILLPLSMALANLVNFLLSTVVLVLYLALQGPGFGQPLWLPVALGSQIALCTGIALLFSAANVFFRDTEHMLSMILLAWFFVTPVIYPIDIVLGSGSSLPEWARALFFMNPMTGILTTYRMGFLGHAAPSAGLLAISHAVAWVTLAVGLLVFLRVQDRMSDEL